MAIMGSRLRGDEALLHLSPGSMLILVLRVGAASWAWVPTRSRC